MKDELYYLLKYLMENGKKAKFGVLGSPTNRLGFKDNDVRSACKKGLVEWIRDDVTITKRGIEVFEEYEKVHGSKTYEPVEEEEIDEIFEDVYEFCMEIKSFGRVFSEEEYALARKEYISDMNATIEKFVATKGSGIDISHIYEDDGIHPLASVENLKRISTEYNGEFFFYHDGHFAIMMDKEYEFWDRETAKQKIEEYKKIK